MTFLFEVFLGSLAQQAQPARKVNLAVMEFQGRQERRVNQVCPAAIPFRNGTVLWSKQSPRDLQSSKCPELGIKGQLYFVLVAV